MRSCDTARDADESEHFGALVRIRVELFQPHSALGQQPPAEFARRWRTELRSPPAPYAPPSNDDKQDELSQ
jgi:hypothetical protein